MRHLFAISATPTARRGSRRAAGLAARLAGALAILLAAASPAVQAQSQPWPSKPVRVVVPFAAGGSADLLARLVGQQLSQATRQPFVIDLKPGAGGALGSVEAARAPADGYTLLFASASSHSVPQHLNPRLPYDPVQDFTPVAHVADAMLVLLGSPRLEARTVQEVIALARRNPGQLNYTSAGNGSLSHLAFELFKSQAGVFITHIPYKGAGAAIPDLISGHVHLTWDAIASGLPHAKDGRLRGIAVSGPKRSPLAPEIPTVVESGLAGFTPVLWFGLFAPKGLPADLARRINEEVNKVLASPEMTARFASLGIEPGRGSPADFAAMMAADSARWGRVVKAANIKPE